MGAMLRKLSYFVIILSKGGAPMITENDVIKAIVECADEKGNVDYYEVANKLSVDMKTLDEINVSLKNSKVAIFELGQIRITEETMRIYNNLTNG